MFRPATLPLAACVLLMAGLAQAQTQSPAPPATIQQGPSTTTSFTPAAPIYQSNMTYGQATGQAATPAVAPTGGALPPGLLPPNASAGSPVSQDTGPGTAIEQGYDPQAQEAARLAREAAAARANDNPRQRGERIATPVYRDTVAKDASATEWLINWKGELVAAGVHPDKVDFEAGRLPREEVSLWASRMLWALRGRNYAPNFEPAVMAAPPVPSTCCQATDCCR